MLPMGTIITVVMFIGLLFASRLPIIGSVQRFPAWLQQLVGSVVILGGAWNVFWYALRHLTEFWGMAALVSGILMMILGTFMVNSQWLPARLISIMPAIKIALLLVACYYAWTIYNL